MAIGVFGDPDGRVRIRPSNLTDVACKAFEVSIPMNGDEVDTTIAVARGEKILQPGMAGGSTRDSRSAKLHTHLLQRLDLTLPYFGSSIGRYVAAACRHIPIRLIET